MITMRSVSAFRRQIERLKEDLEPREFILDDGLASDRLARIGGYLYRAVKGESTPSFRKRIEAAARKLRVRTVYVGPAAPLPGG
jgi:hypothetical protein